jgi:gamma-glutamylputrescine oxidase
VAGYVDSYYARTLAEPGDRPPLDGTIDAEVCVIGGGLAGLATALDLAERGRSVVLLERHRVGWGASGRNGGFASPGYPNGLPALVKKVGLTAAQAMYALSRGAQRLMRERIDRYAIDCGPVEDGALRCAMAGSDESLERYCADMARDFGVEMTYWPASQVRAALATTRYGDAFFNPYTFRLHPLNLARGYARAAESHGARIFEQSPALGLDLAGTRRSVRTARGTVRAETIVLAGGGYIGGLHWPVSMATVPVATFVMVTEPLGTRLTDTIAVPYAISDIKTATNYYRPLADGRLMWGGRVLAWEPAAAALARTLRRDMVSFYPGLADARIEVAWGGMMPYLRHKLPVIGRIADGVWVATGFGGLGVVLTTLAGELIASGLEGDDRWQRFAAFGLPFAGGKLGKVPAQMVYWRHQMAARLGRHKRA